MNRQLKRMQWRASQWIPDHEKAIDFAAESVAERGLVGFEVTADKEVRVVGDPFCDPARVVGRFLAPAVVPSVLGLLDVAAAECGLPRAGLRPAGALAKRAFFDTIRQHNAIYYGTPAEEAHGDPAL